MHCFTELFLDFWWSVFSEEAVSVRAIGLAGPQPEFTCLKSAVETPEGCVKSV